MVNGAGTQFNPLSSSQVLDVAEHQSLKEALCDQSTMRIETVTQQKLPREATNVPSLGTLPMPAVPTPILPEMSTLPRINKLIASDPRKGVLAVLIAWSYRCYLICA